MKKIPLFAILLTLLIASCSKERFGIKGEGPTVSETRQINNFNGVDLSVSAYVEIIKDSTFKVEINAQRNVLDIIETKIINSNLEIGLKKHSLLRQHEPIKIKIYMPQVYHLDVSGSGKIECKLPFQSDNMSLNISGSGEIQYIGQVKNNLNAEISGSGKMYLYSDAVCNQTNISISGSGSIDAQTFKTNYSNVNISGSGSLKQEINTEINGSISGSGNIYYWGNPKVNVSVSGSGRVKRM